VDLLQRLRAPVEIAEQPDALLGVGVHAFTVEDAARLAGIKPSSAWPALARLVKNRRAFSPARGLYIPIPPEYRSWGAVPAAHFIDPLMAHLGRAYYVGYLSAAEVYGAVHQRPQVFQVVVDRDVRARSFGRIRLWFITNRDAALLPTVRRNTPTGTMAVATPELTAMDLANRPEHGGALHNVATVLIDLVRDDLIDDRRLVELAPRFPVAAGRRAGWLVETFTSLRLDALAAAVVRSESRPSRLNKHGPRRGAIDPRWRVHVNTVVEPDL
jgi:predicted transcriptional regulator of viral defense system